MRRVITVATWNVLHRVHAENWGEDVARRRPDESERIAAIAALVRRRTEQVIALQEVSGDQLVELRAALPGRTVHALRYPRVPVPRHGPCPLRDPGEHLVLLVDGPSRQVAAEPFEDDPGKGALAVHAAGTLIVAVHASVDQRRTRQFARLAGLVDAMAGRTAVVLGDFNADRATVASGLGTGFSVADLRPDSLPTRPGRSGERSLNIDHVVVRGATAGGAVADDAAGLSDHNPVRATVRLRASG